MAELYGLSLAAHLDTILTEARDHDSIYGFPLKKVFKPEPGIDTSVDFQGKHAFTPLGPASGPHTQMAQNILLAFLGGSRIMELKTVQVLDELEIPRPCIDARTVGFNVEWSQELKLAESLHEYVTAWILLCVLEELELLGPAKGDPFYHTVFDLSVGYDLKGISSPEVTGWIRTMMRAEQAIAERLAALPERHARFRGRHIEPVIANTLTLSTFHGCPRDQIRAIVEYLVEELDLDVIVKMNPTQLGFEFARETLVDKLGYGHIELDPNSFDEDLQFDEAIAMMKHLDRFAAERGRRVGAKFTNTLVVKNHDTLFSDEVMYLSGTPLHVLSMHAMLHFRRELGAAMPISFSAGIDQHNFVDAVCCGMKPVTTCTDLLRKGGYTRQVNYLRNLTRAMKKADCTTIDQLILQRAESQDGDVAVAGLANAARIVPALLDNPKYRHERNRTPPKKVGTRLDFFDCLTCNICLPVCPNAANTSLPLSQRTIDYHQFTRRGEVLVPSETKTLTLDKPAQIVNLADFCNDCGNCEFFCPEDGGPQILKPRFFSSGDSYRRFAHLDGFFLKDKNRLTGRIGGVEYEVDFDGTTATWCYRSPVATVWLNASGELQRAQPSAELLEGAAVDMLPYQQMKLLLEGLWAHEGHGVSLLPEPG